MNIASLDFAEDLGKLHGSKKTKVYYGGFLRNGLHERYRYISKSKRDTQYLEVC